VREVGILNYEGVRVHKWVAREAVRAGGRKVP
jgi:hypothetical protein